MVVNPNPTFRISSALKNLIGKELITDEFIAIFELVKNAFDANAKTATIVFENIYSKDARIIIVDDGKGMDYSDLHDKWLFVAYSAKREGTEDYRDKIKSKRVYAGAKGVGRFSCDRLGRKLELITLKNKPNAKIENLEVNWEKFEEDSSTEFINIQTTHRTLNKIVYKIKHGTVLEISGLRDTWDRQRILKLKHSLEKLINPDKDNQAKDFQIEIICDDESSNDKKEKDDRKRVNGIIKNRIFETLEKKTTKIESQISEDGKVIMTKLTDRGSWIYTIKEHNEFYIQKDQLKNIQVKLFQLNRAAKNNFYRDMGIHSVEYGSVFMYKNDFRIYPFGEEGDDTLQIDRRKAQGYSRFLGTRDLLGRIEINGFNNSLVESTSRDGGLIKNAHYEKLVEYFYNKVFYRLENYVVNIIEWGDDRVFELEEKVNVPGLTPADVKNEIIDFIKKISKAKNVISVEYDKKFFSILGQRSGKSVNKSLREFAKKAKNKKDKDAYKQAIKLKNEFQKITDDTKKAEEKAERAEEILKYTIKQNSFLEDSVKPDTKEFQSLLHHTEKSTYWINKHISNLIKNIEQNSPKEKLFEIIAAISWENQKIFSFTKYHKSTQFNTFVEKINQDVVSFVSEYANNVCKYYDEYKNISITIKAPPKIDFKMEFSPVDMTVVIDNLLNNSEKHNADKISLEWEEVSNKELKLYISDNGDGINKNVIDRIFDFRFTTTRGGSGLGLYHVRKTLENMNGTIDVNHKYSKGAEFIITFKK